MNAKRILGRAIHCFPARTKALIKAAFNPAVYPRVLQIEPTRRCNLRCVMCPRTIFGGDPKPDMPLDVFKRIVSQFPRTLEAINIQGVGEPLLHEELIDMIEFAKGLGLRTWFFTNLQHLREEDAARLVRCGHNEITVSIDSTNPEQYAQIRPGGTIENVLENMRLLNKIKAAHASALPKLTVHAILMRHTLAQIPRMVATLRSLGVSEIHFTDLDTYNARDGLFEDGSSVSAMALCATMTDDEIRSTLDGIRALTDDTLTVTTPGVSKGIKLHRVDRRGVVTCAELWEMPFVTCDGHMTPCCYASHPSIADMGDFSDLRFEQIWFGAPYRMLRWQHVIGRPPAFCRDCRQRFRTFAGTVPR